MIKNQIRLFSLLMILCAIKIGCISLSMLSSLMSNNETLVGVFGIIYGCFTILFFLMSLAFFNMSTFKITKIILPNEYNWPVDPVHLEYLTQLDNEFSVILGKNK